MAKVSKKVLGFSRGRVADVVFAKFRTETIAKGYQPNVRNPRTLGQQIQRARFAACTMLAKGLVAGIYAGLSDLAQGTKMSPRNLFSNLNLNPEIFDTVTPDSVTIDYSALVLAKGGFERPVCGSLVTDEEPLTAKFVVVAPSMARSTDVSVFGIVYNPEDNQCVVSEAVSNIGNMSVTVPQSWNGVKVYVWAFFAYNGPNDVEHGLYKGMKSNSVYVGSGNIM